VQDSDQESSQKENFQQSSDKKRDKK